MIKIAFPTEDGKTISRHFGQAPLFVVATIQPDGSTEFEQREKYSHAHHPEPHEHEHGPQGHGHANMFASIRDCQVLISGGMGEPAYESAVAHSLQVLLTGENSIEAALDSYRAGKLESDPRRVHKHR
jgi:predicted Fe-Mo cluster-binding NifX family protein